MYNPYETADWLRYDDDADDYYDRKAHAKTRWESRKATMDKHSTYGRVR